MTQSNKLTRRGVLGVVGAASAVPLLSGRLSAQHAEHPKADPSKAHGSPTVAWDTTLFFFNDVEARFVEAAVDRLIPPDPQWAGAASAGVLYYIDRQLASAYGSGARMYLAGPWEPDAPAQQGYQLRHTPAELYRVAIAEIGDVCQNRFGRGFGELSANQQDDVLKGLETGEVALPSVPSPTFFETLLANTIEGFFADPAYGGNRDMVGWRMVGFPGAYAQYLAFVDVHGAQYTRRPIGISDQAERQRHLAGHGKAE